MTSAKSYEAHQRIDALVEACGPVPADISVPDVTANGVNKPLGLLTIPGGTVGGTEVYEGHALGTFSTAGTAPTTATQFILYADGVGSGQIANFGFPSSFLVGSLSNLGWSIWFKLYWTSKTRAVCEFRVSWHTAAGQGNVVNSMTVQNLTGIDTSTDKDITLAFAWGGSGHTLKTEAVHIRRVS